MEPKMSLSNSQKLAAPPCPEQDGWSPHPSTLFCKKIRMEIKKLLRWIHKPENVVIYDMLQGTRTFSLRISLVPTRKKLKKKNSLNELITGCQKTSSVITG
jgi:hypothetical protein